MIKPSAYEMCVLPDWFLSLDRHSPEPRMTPPTYYSLVHKTKHLTIKISTLLPHNTNKKTYSAIPTTGVMRGHRVYIGLGDCPQEAAQKCLSKIVGQEVRGTLSESQLDAIFSNDLVSDDAPNQEFPQTRRGKT